MFIDICIFAPYVCITLLMDTLPRILLACPTAEVKDYIMQQWLDFIINHLTYPELDILIIDNSRNPEYVKKIQGYVDAMDNKYNREITVIHYQPYPEEKIRYYMMNCNNIIRKCVIDMKYDNLFSLECDVFPPVNIIEHLLCFNKKVISIPYFIGQGENSYLLNMKFEEYGYYRLSQKMQPYETFLWCDGKLKIGYMTGMGCMLIHNSILKRIPFRVPVDDTDGHADSYFHQDLVYNNIPAYVDTSVFALHYNKDWNEIYKKEKL